MKAYRFDKKGYFLYEMDCQLDPLESEKQGKEIYLLPADSTLKEPLPEKDGYFVIFNGENWEYKEKPKPTHNDLIYAQIDVYKNYLSSSDYWGQKYIDGEYTEDEWEVKKAQRKAWRVKIRELEAQLDPENGENSTAGGV